MLDSDSAEVPGAVAHVLPSSGSMCGVKFRIPGQLMKSFGGDIAKPGYSRGRLAKMQRLINAGRGGSALVASRY